MHLVKHRIEVLEIEANEGPDFHPAISLDVVGRRPPRLADGYVRFHRKDIVGRDYASRHFFNLPYIEGHDRKPGPIARSGGALD